ncbi:hypothetical protein EIP86_007628 [Pleurotus ostreatoroseus]|nr:hypothetical protein EIP86_007628 [Pleurotus ostreatoroseus]
MSCTSTIEHARPFQLDGWTVTLVDTPGFDDTTKSDADVLGVVTEYLATQYRHARPLHGALYLHRITDNRLSGAASRALRAFHALCGPLFLPHTALATTMWARADPAAGAAREAELRAHAGEMRLLRADGTREGAHAVVRAVLASYPPPSQVPEVRGAPRPPPMRIQQELVDERLPLAQTAAGAALLAALAAQAQAHAREAQELEAEYADAVRRKDEETREELEEARARLEAERAKLEGERRRLVEMRVAEEEDEDDAPMQGQGQGQGMGTGMRQEQEREMAMGMWGVGMAPRNGQVDPHAPANADLDLELRGPADERGKLLPSIPGAMPEDDPTEGHGTNTSGLNGPDSKETGSPKTNAPSFLARLRHGEDTLAVLFAVLLRLIFTGIALSAGRLFGWLGCFGRGAPEPAHDPAERSREIE